MKKTGRVLLVLLVIVVAALLLYPTIRWYFFVPESTKTAAAGSNENIRDYSRGQASRGVRALTSLLQEDRDAAIPEDFMYLRKDAETALKERGMERPEKWTVYTLLSAFPSESALFQAIEDHTRSQLLDAKKLSGNVLQLGLDLRGGMSVVLEADTASYAATHDGEVPSGAELTAMLQDDIDILTSRIDQFGVSEPDIRLQGSDQIRQVKGSHGNMADVWEKMLFHALQLLLPIGGGKIERLFLVPFAGHKLKSHGGFHGPAFLFRPVRLPLCAGVYTLGQKFPRLVPRLPCRFQ